MTYKHAISILNEIKSIVYFDEEKEAIDIAIKTLSSYNQNKLQTCDNCKNEFIKDINKSSCPFCGKKYPYSRDYWR